MKKYIVLLLICVSVSFVYGQQEPPWTVTQTLNNHTIIVPSGIVPASVSLPLYPGDYIGVFYDSLGKSVCAGYTQFDGLQNSYITIWGEDAGLDGFAMGEKFRWKVWSNLHQLTFSCNVVYDQIQFTGSDEFIANGISGISQISLLPGDVELGGSREICYGVSDTLFPLTSLLHTLNSVEWFDGANNTISTGNYLPVSASSNTMVYVQITDVVGNVFEDSVEIIVNPLPVFSLGSDTFISNHQAISIQVPGYETYLWNTGSNLPTISISEAGTYWLEVSDANNCSYLDSLVVSSPPWSFEPTNTNHTLIIPSSCSIDINNVALEEGDYLGVFYDLLGMAKCAGFARYTPSENLYVSAWGADANQLMGGFGPGEKFQWRVWDASANQEFCVIAGYNFAQFTNDSVFVANGISGLASLSASPLAIEAGAQIETCAQETVTIVPMAYGLSSLANSLLELNGQLFTPTGTGFEFTLTPDSSGIAVISATSNNGITAIDSVAIVVNPSPQVDLGNDTFLTANQCVDLGVPSSGNFLWSSGETTSTIQACAAGKYWLSYTTEFGCMGSDSISVSSPPWLLHVSNNNHSIIIPQTCTYSLGSLLLETGDYIGVFYDSLGVEKCAGFTPYISGKNNYVTAWGADAIQSGFQVGEGFKWRIWKKSTGMEFALSAAYDLSNFPNQGQYLVNGLSGVLGLHIDSLYVDAGGNAQICPGEDFVPIPTILTNNTLLSKNWYLDGVQVSTAISPMLSISSSAWLKLVVEDAGQNICSDSLFVDVFTGIAADLGPDQPFQPTAPVVLNPGTFDQYLWNDQSGYPSLEVNAPGVYSVEVVDSNACHFHDTIVVFGPNWVVNSSNQNHTIIVPSSFQLLNGLTISEGDFIGVFYDSLSVLRCAGFQNIKSNQNNYITAWGQSSGHDGFATGEKFRFKYWNHQNNEETWIVPTYNLLDFPNDSTYQSNGISGFNAAMPVVLDLSPLDEVVLCMGDSAFLQAEVESNSSPLQFSWIYNGVEVSTSQDLNFTAENNGQLSIEVSDCFGNTISDTASVWVDRYLFDIADTLYTCNGDQLNLAFHAQGLIQDSTNKALPNYCTPEVNGNDNIGIVSVNMNGSCLLFEQLSSPENYHPFFDEGRIDFVAGEIIDVAVATNQNSALANNILALGIDWDQDGSFDANGESYTFSNVPAVFLFQLEVPDSITPGQALLRIKFQQGNDWQLVSDLCQPFYYGEVEDYYVELLQTQGDSTVVYSWTDPANQNYQGSQLVFDPITLLNEGAYSLLMTSSNGCNHSKDIYIDVNNNPPPSIAFLFDTLYTTQPDTIILDPGVFGSYLWNDGATTSSYQLSTSGMYSVTVSDYGCHASDSVFVGDIQNVILVNGWSIISTYVDPSEPNMEAMFFPLGSKVIIIKNGIGQVCWVQYGLNMIGNHQLGDGYQVKMSMTDTLVVKGLMVRPDTTPLDLPFGWCIVAYLRTSPMSIVQALLPISSEIIIVKNGIGQVYWVQYGLNLIGDMKPGEGYQIKMETAQIFCYPAND